MIPRISRLAAVAALVGSLVAIPAASAHAQNNPNRNRLDVPVNGTVVNGTIAGTFKISKFEIQNGVLVALGQLNATVSDPKGVRTIVSNIAWPVAHAGSADAGDFGSCDAGSSTRACDILNLVLGPLHLDLLGLVVDLNQVVLNITGTTGAGDLLGNLLCAITGLLDAGSLGQQVVNLLNQLVGILAGL
jgi:hypothetical protein